jgi:PrtD family type I secretion system ABC transporter
MTEELNSSDKQGVQEKVELSKLAKLLKQCKQAFVFVFVLTFIIEILSIVPILYTLNMYDRVLTSRSEVTLISLTILLVCAEIFWSGLEWIRRRMLVRISLRIDWDLASNVFDASFRRFIGRKKVNVHQVLGDVVQLRQFLTGRPLIALMSAPYALFFIGFCAFFHVYLAVFALCATALLLLLTYLKQKVSSPLLRDANEASAEANRLTAQSLRQSETALALGMHNTIRARWYELHKGYIEMQVHASEAAGLLGSISGFLTKLLPSLKIALGITLAIQGVITGGMVMAANFLLTKAISPIRMILGSWKDISNARQAYDRLTVLLAEDDEQKSRMSLPPPVGHLTVVDMSINPGRSPNPVLQGINFQAVPGSVTAIVGPSAAGKTSLVKALAGIWPTSKGNVRLDGAEVSDWIQDDLGKYIGYVPQEVDFFEATIAENIARLGPIDSGKVVEAATLAGVHEMILSFSQGYDTRLGETGHVLTGGQKQRIAIARALYDDPCFLLLDEPNASLDEAGERKLVETIKELKARKKTIVFTTHKPELVNIADNLLILNAGKQAGYGAVSTMMAAARKLKEAKQIAPATAKPVASEGSSLETEGAAA